jgi:hypothetical protein
MVLALVGVVGGVSWWWLSARPISLIKQRVLSALVDPDSAKFGEIRYSPKTDGGCGSVNARNRMGGYMGFTEFVAMKSGEVTFAPAEASESASTTDKLEAVTKRIGFLRVAIAQCPD